MAETASYPNNLSAPLPTYGESVKTMPKVLREVAEQQAQMSPRVALDLVHDNPELFSVQGQTAPDLTPDQQDQLEAKTQRYENQPEIFDGAHRIAEVVARTSDEAAESRATLAEAEARMRFAGVLGKPDAASAEVATLSGRQISGIEQKAKFDIKAIQADIADKAHQRVHDMFDGANDNLAAFLGDPEVFSRKPSTRIVTAPVPEPTSSPDPEPAPRPAPEPVIEPAAKSSAELTARIPQHLQERARAAMNRAGAPENSEPAKAAEEPQPQTPEPLFPNRPSSLDWSADLPSDAADVYEASSFSPPGVELDQPIAADLSEPEASQTAPAESTPETEFVFGQSQMEADHEIDKVVWSLEHAQRLGDVRSVSELSDRLQKLWGVNRVAKKSPEPRQWGDAADDLQQGWDFPDGLGQTPEPAVSGGWEDVPDIKPISTDPADRERNIELLAEADKVRRNVLGDSTEKLPLRKRVKGRLGVGRNSFKPTKGDSSPSQPAPAPSTVTPQPRPSFMEKLTGQVTPVESSAADDTLVAEPEDWKEAEEQGRARLGELRTEVKRLLDSPDELKRFMTLSESDKESGKALSDFEDMEARVRMHMPNMMPNLRNAIEQMLGDVRDLAADAIAHSDIEKMIAAYEADAK